MVLVEPHFYERTTDDNKEIAVIVILRRVSLSLVCHNPSSHGNSRLVLLKSLKPDRESFGERRHNIFFLNRKNIVNLNTTVNERLIGTERE